MPSKTYMRNLAKAVAADKNQMRSDHAMFALNVINSGGASMKLREQAEKIVSSFLAQKP